MSWQQYLLNIRAKFVLNTATAKREYNGRVSLVLSCCIRILQKKTLECSAKYKNGMEQKSCSGKIKLLKPIQYRRML